jgi:hypothetical protein
MKYNIREEEIDVHGVVEFFCTILIMFIFCCGIAFFCLPDFPRENKTYKNVNVGAVNELEEKKRDDTQ